jgi:hypothetical protein
LQRLAPVRPKAESFLFDEPNQWVSHVYYVLALIPSSDIEEDGGFSSPVVTKLIQSLEEVPLQALSENENEQLLVLLQATLDVKDLLLSL